jgi:hypothetical protein
VRRRGRRFNRCGFALAMAFGRVEGFSRHGGNGAGENRTLTSDDETVAKMGHLGSSSTS